MSPLLAKRLSDESLGSRLASGEAAAFDELYRRYVNRLAAYGAHLLGDGAAGDDVAQATMLKAYGALRDGRVPDLIKPWLYRIAHNVAIDLVIRRREWPTAELPERGSADAAPIAGALVAALAALPERQRRVYVLRELHGLRIDETAAELSLSATQVEQSLFAARNRLAEHLVFGDRLTCVSVQRLAAGPLDRDERRALKSHLRSCSSCRNGLGLRGRALSAPPVTLEWLRGLLSSALGGGAPVVAKVGAAVATVSFAAGVPAAVETVPVHPLPVRAVPIAHLPRAQPARVQARTRLAGTEPVVVPVALARTSAAWHESRHGKGGGGNDSAAVSSATVSGRPGDDGGARSGEPTTISHEGHGGGEGAAALVSSSGGSGSDGGSRPSGGPGSSTTTVTTTVVASPAPTGNSGSGSGSPGSGTSGGGDQALSSGSDGGSGGSSTTSTDGSRGGGTDDGGGSDGRDSGGGGSSSDPLTGH